MSFESWPGLEGISSLIEALEPSMASGMFPDLSREDINKIGASGRWSRLDVIAAIVDRKGQYLMANFDDPDEVSDGVWGPLARTMFYGYDDGQWLFEKPVDTLGRIIGKDLGINSSSELGLTARPTGAWIIDEWPLGDRKALAICPVMRIRSRGCKKIQSEQVAKVDFLLPDEIRRKTTLPGTIELVDNIEASGLATSLYRTPLCFPDKARELPNHREIFFP